MKIINSFSVLVLVFLSGCSPQPSEEQKIAVEKEIIGCLFAVNETMDEDDSPLAETFSALGKLAVNSSFENKKWRLDTDEVTQKDTITVDFKNEDTLFSCSFSSDSDGKYEIQSVLRNSEEVFNKDDNEKIKKEKAALKERQRIEEIKQWHEKGYSNTSYKYYEKRHVDSKPSFGDPTLKVVCDPKRLRVEFDKGQVSFNGRENVEFTFNQGGKSVKKKIDLTSSGTVGVKKKTSLGSDVTYDENQTHAFLDLLETSMSVSVEGSTFNIDDHKQVPCLNGRKENRAKQKKKYEDYLSRLKEGAGQNIGEDKLTNETQYVVLGETDALSDEIFGSVGSQVLGQVTLNNNKILSADAFTIAFGTRQRTKYDKAIGSMKITFMDGSEKVEIAFRCSYDYASSQKNQYGYANEYCEPSNMEANDLRILGNASKVRVSADEFVFDSINGDETQKKFVSDLIRVAKIIALP